MRNKPLRFFLSDMNSDGLQDLFVIHSEGYYVYYNQGGPITKTNMIFSSATGCCSVGSNLECVYMIIPGDFNGDGMMDILSDGKNDGKWKLYINNGNGGFQSYSACSLPNITKQSTNNDCERYTCNVMDFDGDGRDDVIFTKAKYNSNGSFDKTYTYWMRSYGTFLGTVHDATSNVENDALSYRVLVGDFDGDGRNELFNYGNDLAQGSNANGSAVYRYYDVDDFSNQTGKITKIVGDYGASIDITYSTLADINVYSKGTNTLYPAPCVSIPINVVKSITCNNGAAGISSKNLSYEGLRIHKTGRGILGFEKRVVTDNISGEIVESGISEWNQEFYVPSTTYSTITIDGFVSHNTTAIVYQTIDSIMYYPSYNTVTAVDFDGNTVITTNEFDISNGMPIRETESYGANFYRITEYCEYDTLGRRLQPEFVTKKSSYPGDVPFSVTTKYIYDNITGAVTSQIENWSIDSLRLTTTYTYTSQGNVLSKSISGRGIGSYVQYYEYDNTKRFVTREYSIPAAFVYEYTYDTWGNRLTETDNTNPSSPIINNYDYDHWGNLIGSRMADGSTNKIVRGWSNDPSKKYFILEEGDGKAWVKTWYDNAGREVLTESVGLKNVPISKTINYNNRGMAESIENKEGDNTITQTYTYDSRGRIESESSSTGSSIGYQYGNRTVIITSNNHSTYRRYDAVDNLVEVTDPAGATVEYFYSSNGNILRAEIDGHVYSYTYDAVGNKLSYSDPDAGVTTYTYDALGREVTRTDSRNVLFTNNYDYLGRITSRSAGDMVITYSYGNSGNSKFRLVNEIMNSWEINYEYDEIGRIIAEEKGGHRTEYVYSDKGQLVRKTWADPGMPQRHVNYSYDSYGNVIGINAISGAIQWNQTGYTGKNSTSTMRLDSNSSVITRSTTLGDNGYLSNETLSRGGTTLRNTSYIYDGTTGNLTRRTSNGVTETFTYDSSDRLTRMTKTGQQTMSISYDANGNIINKTGIGTYYYNENNKPHAVTSVDNTSNVIPNGYQTITYNAWGKVSEINAVVENNTYTYQIIYGPDLQRVLTLLWKNDELLHLVNYGDDYEEKYMSSSGEVTSYYYVTGGDGSTAVYTSRPMSGDKAYFVDQDQIGNILALYDQYGTKRYGAEFDPWGRRTVMSGSIEYDRGFTGHEHIDESGLIDMNGRMYDPLLGRFISVDPVIQMPDNPQNYNRYSYCLNNPLKYTDPSGESIAGIALCCGLIYGTGNMAAHYIRGDKGHYFEYFLQGFLAGAALGATYGFAPLLPYGNYIQTYMAISAQCKIGVAAVSSVAGAVFSQGRGFINSWKTFLGNFYINEKCMDGNGGFWLGVWQGYSRHSWESLQTGVGHTLNQLRNLAGQITRVDYFAGNTYVIREGIEGTNGSFGCFMKMKINYSIDTDFEEWVTKQVGTDGKLCPDPLFLHEYGHTFQSRRWGPLYFVVGVFSFFDGLDKDHIGWTEKRANSYAADYFFDHYQVNWGGKYIKHYYDGTKQYINIKNDYPIDEELFERLSKR